MSTIKGVKIHLRVKDEGHDMNTSTKNLSSWDARDVAFAEIAAKQATAIAVAEAANLPMRLQAQAELVRLKAEHGDPDLALLIEQRRIAEVRSSTTIKVAGIAAIGVVSIALVVSVVVTCGSVVPGG